MLYLNSHIYIHIVTQSKSHTFKESDTITLNLIHNDTQTLSQTVKTIITQLNSITVRITLSH